MTNFRPFTATEARSRILHYLRAAIATTTEADSLPGTSRVAAAWLDDLQARWPASQPLAPYPAFTASGAQDLAE